MAYVSPMAPSYAGHLLARGVRRNAYRKMRQIRTWRTAGFAERANEQANLLGRKQACQGATLTLARALAENQRTGNRHDSLAILHDYWSKQPRSRVVSRILKQLRS
jgi:hypothetical protein